MRARRQGLSFQVAGGGLGWQVAGGELGRAAIAIAAARDRRWGVVGSWLGSKTSYLRPRTDVMAITSLPKGRLCRDAVPTLPRYRGTKKDSTWCCPYLFGFWLTGQPFNRSTRYAGNVNAGSLRISPPAIADSWARMPVQVQLAD